MNITKMYCDVCGENVSLLNPHHEKLEPEMPSQWIAIELPRRGVIPEPGNEDTDGVHYRHICGSCAVAITQEFIRSMYTRTTQTMAFFKVGE